MIKWINSSLSAAFNAMDRFGHEHWGFVLTFVFLWWLLGCAIRGLQNDVRWAKMKLRREPATDQAKMATGVPTHIKPGMLDNPPPPMESKASSQAGLASFSPHFYPSSWPPKQPTRSHLAIARKADTDEE